MNKFGLKTTFLTWLTILLSIKIWLVFYWYIRNSKWLFNLEKMQIHYRHYFSFFNSVTYFHIELISVLHPPIFWPLNRSKLTYVTFSVFSLCSTASKPQLVSSSEKIQVKGKESVSFLSLNSQAGIKVSTSKCLL